MSRLKSRNHYIPGGFKFYIPETGWNSTPDASFDVIVNEIIAHRKGQPHLTQKNGWATDYGQVSEELDAYCAAICKSMGWNQFIMEGGGDSALPFSNSPPPPPTDPSRLTAAASSLKAIWQGVKTLNEWIDSGEPAVAPDLSAGRALVCSTCPQNAQGGLESWFTIPASEAIRRQLEKVQDRKLSTPHDDKLNVCNVCWCPMKLKVHVPIVSINLHISEATREKLKTVINPSGGCWIPKEIFV